MIKHYFASIATRSP